MSKAEKSMGITRRSTRKREPLIEPIKTLHKKGPCKKRRFVLVERITMAFGTHRTLEITHRYATLQAREQARAKYERSTWRKDRTTFEEYEE